MASSLLVLCMHCSPLRASCVSRPAELRFEAAMSTELRFEAAMSTELRFEAPASPSPPELWPDPPAPLLSLLTALPSELGVEEVLASSLCFAA